MSIDNLSKTSFLEVLNNSDLKDALGKQYTNAALTPIFASLTAKNLLEQNKQSQYYCNRTILHYVIMDAVTGKYAKENTSSITKIANYHSSLVDKLKLGIYLNNSKLFLDATSVDKEEKHQKLISQLRHYFVNIRLHYDWLKSLEPEIQYWVVAAKIYNYLYSGTLAKDHEIAGLKLLIADNLNRWLITSDFIADLFLDFFLLDGDIEKISHLITITQISPLKNHAVIGVLEFLHGNTSNALANFDIAIKAIKDITKKRNVCLSGTYGICHILSLLQTNHAQNGPVANFNSA